MADATILSDFLQELAVPHTVRYSDINYRKMPFQSLYGFSKLLEKYGIDSEGIRLDNKDEVVALPVPFLAQTPLGFLIVTDVSPDAVTYLSEGVRVKCSLQTFKNAWTGVAFMAFPSEGASEPGFKEHNIEAQGDKVKAFLLPLCLAALFLYFYIGNGLWRDVSMWFLSAFNLAGLYFTYLLVQKSAHISSKKADVVCGVLQKGGCDTILSMSASKFYGLFGWSEVGFTYFSVSLLCLLIFPQFTNLLALCNACCLPFTFWSIWYQKFKAKHWCTLCVCVQATLWCLFFSYLFGGWFSGLFPLSVPLFVLGATYLTVLLALNRIMPLIEKTEPDETVI